MNSKSIRTHLKPYSIVASRRTTVAHAFASALAPVDKHDPIKVDDALAKLGQADLSRLTCVYCEQPAQTWDHLENLVKDGQLAGYGHQVGNLVPSCRHCNSAKGGRPYREFVGRLSALSEEQKEALVARLESHLGLASPVLGSASTPGIEQDLKQFQAIQQKVLDLLREADAVAERIRSQRDG
jgi:hypothetical protein